MVKIEIDKELDSGIHCEREFVAPNTRLQHNAVPISERLNVNPSNIGYSTAFHTTDMSPIFLNKFLVHILPSCQEHAP